MYCHWAERRRVVFSEIKDGAGRASPILHFTGFGAFRTLHAEAGLHVFDEQVGDTARRLVARVTVAAGPEQDVLQAGHFTCATELLLAVPAKPTIVRRYREVPAPMVRDATRGWRTGRLDKVLDGDFDLMAAASG